MSQLLETAYTHKFWPARSNSSIRQPTDLPAQQWNGHALSLMADTHAAPLLCATSACLPLLCSLHMHSQCHHHANNGQQQQQQQM